MKKLLVLSLLLIGFNSYSQKVNWQNLDGIKAPENLENVSTKLLFEDSLASSFLIFIKKDVPLHRHLQHSEHVYILDGEGIMLLGESRIMISKGDLIFIPKNTPHSVTVSSTQAMKVLSIQAPRFDGSDRVNY